ncbi:branched-chain amino acid ABC transporter permease [Lusitaniella coriacea LEGE 07157]|uniref:Branched-chain amino acid ABC transporter permease n=1 Tax=Lusitaniella coriacea LEGE 07157 TaxID=945747 RepID=A0A8J7E168_9CYAN|nr:branched-chain amino acid ABC transporter permease [Lusitaniella coriacea]MBE9117476.1 branched-chain amino acid ABC transporter permease [Lusitaniella coriacea LEGE 07157]
MLEQILEILFNVISIGSVLLLAALGLAIVFGLMGVINLAHGELMMLGAYSTYVVQQGFELWAKDALDYYLWVALPVAFIFTALVGVLLEKGVIRFLYGRPLETLLATWGVSLILRQFVRSVDGVLLIGIALFCLLFFGGMWVLRRRVNWESTRDRAIAILLPLSLAITSIASILLGKNEALTNKWFGSRNLDITFPSWLDENLSPENLPNWLAWLGNWMKSVGLEDFSVPRTRLFIIGLTIVCLLGVYLFLNRSNWGLRIRAVTQNRSMSACLGIPTRQVDAFTFALGSGLAGIAGCAVTLIGSVGPNMGGNYIVDAFMVVVVGGVGNLFGSILAALGISTANYLISVETFVPMFEALQTQVAFLKPLWESFVTFFEFFGTSSMAKVLVFALIIAFLQIRPAGIFPQKGRSVEL